MHNIHTMSMLASRINYFNVCPILEEMETSLVNLLAAIQLISSWCNMRLQSLSETL